MAFIFYIIMAMKKKSILFDALGVIVTSVAIVFLLVNFVLMPCQVEGSSMYPTLHDKDFGYSFVLTKNLGVKRFDTIVIQLSDKLLVKRVIGLPNDKIEYIDNKLYINDEYVEEPFLGDVVTEDLKVELSDDEYYCLGDNRSVSKDSRYYGPFDIEQIDARGVFIIYPFERLGVKK